MPLRSTNDGGAVHAALNALASVMPPNTALAAASGTVLVNALASLEQGALTQSGTTWPALLLQEGQHSRARIAWRTWQQHFTALCLYCDRPDQQTNSNDTIWSNIDLDIRRMMANIEDNPTLTVASVRYALDIAKLELSPFSKPEQNVDITLIGFPILRRVLTVHVNLPAYLSAD